MRPERRLDAVRQQVGGSAHRRQALLDRGRNRDGRVHVRRKLPLHRVEYRPVESRPDGEIVDGVVDPGIDIDAAHEVGRGGNRRQGDPAHAVAPSPVAPRAEAMLHRGVHGRGEARGVEPPLPRPAEAGVHHGTDDGEVPRQPGTGSPRREPRPAAAKRLAHVLARQSRPTRAYGVDPQRRERGVVGQQVTHQVLATRRVAAPVVREHEQLHTGGGGGRAPLSGRRSGWPTRRNGLNLRHGDGHGDGSTAYGRPLVDRRAAPSIDQSRPIAK